MGVIYVKEDQFSEEQILDNNENSILFDEFLTLLGDRVRLRGFDKYKGGLDTVHDLTGEQIVWCKEIKRERKLYTYKHTFFGEKIIILIMIFISPTQVSIRFTPIGVTLRSCFMYPRSYPTRSMIRKSYNANVISATI